MFTSKYRTRFFPTFTEKSSVLWLNAVPVLKLPGALIILSATRGHLFRPGKNSLSLKQLAGLPKTPWRDQLIIRV
jgi:hypothetical protein